MKAALMLCLAALPLAANELNGNCAEPFRSPVRPGDHLSMHLRAGAIQIRGTDQAAIVVTCGFRNDDPATAKIRFRTDRDELIVHGGSDDNFHLSVEVPRKSGLFLRITAGELTVSGIAGDKDVEMNAGQMNLEVGDPAAYAHADASLWSGEIDAAAFGAERGGLFRSWSSDNPSGKYRLHAHLVAGQIRLIR